jgi:hypothetical protein
MGNKPIGGRHMDHEIRLTHHAHEQYCIRVEPIEWDDLIQRIRMQQASGLTRYIDNGYMHIDGVWWAYEMDGEQTLFVTCYGKTDIDMPKAIRWAVRHNDRINLSDLYG